MEGLLTPVSTSYKSSEKPAEDALYVHLSSLNVILVIRYPHASQPRHQVPSLTLLIGLYPGILL